MTNASKKHVLLITNTLLKGGAEKQCVLLANYLVQYFRVTLLVYCDEIDQDLCLQVDNEKIDILILKGNLLRKLMAVGQLVRKSRPEVTISFLLTSNFIGGVFGKLFGVSKRITGIRTNEIKGWKWNVQLMIHRHFATNTVFNNHAAALSFFQKGFEKRKSLIIPNAVMIPEDFKSFSRYTDDLKMLSVARFVPEKDLETAIQSFSIIKSLWPSKNITYKILGYGAQEYFLKSKISELGLSKSVIIEVSPTDLERHYLDSDVYLSSSINEGMSNTIMEAMSYGLPIIATDVGDNRHLVKNRYNGFLISAKHPQAIADAFGEFVSQPGLLETMGKKSREIVDENFSVEKMGLAFKNLIDAD
jgi:glycosyltransferase involved in cell wall biosynthesis